VPVIRERIFGQVYAKTLATWRNNFRSAWPNLTPLGFDERFRPRWEYYLASCEAGFLSGNINVRQVVFRNAGLSKPALCRPRGSFRVVENTQRKRQLVLV
jgi:cyclopropane-fatty-acyl-phospholipid synthase